MTSELLIFIVSCIVAGVFAGLSSGLLGLGGGLVIVPVLNYLLPAVYHVSPQYLLPICITTSFAVIIFNTTNAARKQAKLNNVDWRAVAIMVPALVTASVLMSNFVVGINPGYLKIFFGFVLCYSAYAMFKKKATAATEETKGHLPLGAGLAAGATIGAISATAGISGGSFLGPLFSSFKFPIKRALGTSSACGMFLSTASFLSYLYAGRNVDTGVPLSFGYFSLVAFLGFFVTSPFFAGIGVKLQNHLPAAKVRKIFAVFLLFITVDMLWSGYKLIAHV